MSSAEPVPAATLTIDRRFNGPANSGNGGYVCGRLAAHLLPAPRVARVRLRVPPPLGRVMQIEVGEDSALLRDASEDATGTIVAEARALHPLDPVVTTFATDLPPTPTFAEATVAARDFRGFHSHPYPGCFVCGPARANGGGLRILAGALPGSADVAAPWIPDASLAAPGDPAHVAPEFVWAALDCPGGFSFPLPSDRAILLGELAVERLGEVRIGERCVVVGTELGADGRKHFVRTVLFGEDGTCRGVGRATWFEVPAPLRPAVRHACRDGLEKETP